MTQTRQTAMRTASVIAGTAIAFNGAFFFLSQMYFESHKLSAPGVGEVLDTKALAAARTSFALLTLLVAAISFAAAFAPRIIGHATAVLLGLAGLVAAVESISHDMPTVMSAVLIAVGVLLPTLAHFSWRGSRAAWAYLCAIIGVFAVVTFFGAPKVRNVLDIGFWTAMLIPGLMFVALAALTMARGEYRAKA